MTVTCYILGDTLLPRMAREADHGRPGGKWADNDILTVNSCRTRCLPVVRPVHWLLQR